MAHSTCWVHKHKAMYRLYSRGSVAQHCTITDDHWHLQRCVLLSLLLNSLFSKSLPGCYNSLPWLLYLDFYPTVWAYQRKQLDRKEVITRWYYHLAVVPIIIRMWSYWVARYTCLYHGCKFWPIRLLHKRLINHLSNLVLMYKVW